MSSAIERPPLVVSILASRHLVWVQDGRAWVSDCIEGWQGERPVAFGPWREITEGDVVPGLGGRVLTQQEVGRLVAPHTGG